MNKSITAAVILGSLASLLLFQAGPANARPCQERYHSCSAHCFQRHDDPLPCINRTCIPQERQCSAGEGRSGGGGGKGGPASGNKPKGESKGGKPGGTNFSSVLLRIRKSSPPAPSILEPTGGFSHQGPAATGAPAGAGHAAPPVIIR